VEWDRGTNSRGTRRVENSERVANSKRVWIVAETPTISTVASETSEGHRKRPESRFGGRKDSQKVLL
jgi:hypothetical protein